MMVEEIGRTQWWMKRGCNGEISVSEVVVI